MLWSSREHARCVSWWAAETKNRAEEFLTQHKESIECVGNRSAGGLEISSTIAYTDRNFAERGRRSSFAELVRTVHAIKLYLSLDVIEGEARSLDRLGLLRAAV